MFRDVTRAGKYLLSTGYFIIVLTQLFLLFYIVIDKKNLKLYLRKWIFLWKIWYRYKLSVQQKFCSKLMQSSMRSDFSRHICSLFQSYLSEYLYSLPQSTVTILYHFISEKNAHELWAKKLVLADLAWWLIPFKRQQIPAGSSAHIHATPFLCSHSSPPRSTRSSHTWEDVGNAFLHRHPEWFCRAFRYLWPYANPPECHSLKTWV